MASENTQLATFGAGCFWCVEAIFKELKGVDKVVSGYSGGSVPNPTYEQVCGGTTGHAEAAQITFDPKIISYEQILEVFWLTHDPTTANQQGDDVGPQYRSAIFYHTDEQKRLAEDSLKKMSEDQIFTAKIVTEILPFTDFYPAENYHQDYFANNANKPYCQIVINPKLNKFRQKFARLLKK